LIKKHQNIISKIAPLVTVFLILTAWFFVSEGGIVAEFLLPSPVAVMKALSDNFAILMHNACITVEEALAGLIIGVAISFAVATLMDRFSLIYSAIYPLLIISQTIPTIAIAPMLVLCMGFGMAPKITMVVITTFFPVTVGLLDGYKSTDPDKINLMRSMGAGKIAIFRHLKISSAMPGFFSGLKVSASYAVVSALVAEWMGGFEGLGVYMTRAKKAYAFDKMFAVIIIICVVSLLLIAFVSVAESLVLRHKKAVKSKQNN